MEYIPTSYNLLWFLRLNGTDAYIEMKIETFLIQHWTKDQMVPTKTYFNREDVVSKGKLMQIRSTVKLLTHAISQCLPITNWNRTLIVLSEQNPG